MLLFCILCLSSCRDNTDITTKRDDKRKIIILTETQGYRHASIEDGLTMFNCNSEEWNIETIHLQESDELPNYNISNYSIIVLLNTTGDYLNDEEQTMLKAYVNNGGSILGIHAATDAEYDWPWYGYMLGGWFNSHPEIQDANCKVVYKDHPITAGIPESWNRRDEWYNFKNLAPDNQVLITIDEHSYTGGLHAGYHPISWCRDVGNGRVFYTAMGHTAETYTEPLFILQIKNAINWLAAKK